MSKEEKINRREENRREEHSRNDRDDERKY